MDEPVLHGPIEEGCESNLQEAAVAESADGVVAVFFYDSIGRLESIERMGVCEMVTYDVASSEFPPDLPFFPTVDTVRPTRRKR